MASPIRPRLTHEQMQEASQKKSSAMEKLKETGTKAFDTAGGWLEDGKWKGIALSVALIVFSIFMMTWGIPHMGMINYNDVGVGSVTTIMYMALACGAGLWGLYNGIKKRFSPQTQNEFFVKKIESQENLKLAIFAVLLAGIVAIGAIGMKQSLAGHNIGGNSWVTTGLALGFAGVAGFITLGYNLHNRVKVFKPVKPEEAQELQRLRNESRREGEVHAAQRAAAIHSSRVSL